MVAEAADGQSATGRKLIVSIAGIEAEASAATGSPVFTNTAESGVYDTVEGEEVLIKEFDRPTVTITNKSYVLDYGKEATFNTSDLGLAAASHINSDMSKITTANTAVDQKYGKSALASNAITYTPQTMNWDGYDSVFAFGTDSSSANQWARMNVLPANSVYYEELELNILMAGQRLVKSRRILRLLTTALMAGKTATRMTTLTVTVQPILQVQQEQLQPLRLPEPV